MRATKKWLTQAASRTPPDAQFVADMAAQLDDAGLFTDADAFLHRVADAIPDVSVQRLLAQRLWETGKAAELEERLKNQTPQSPGSDGVLMAYRAMALHADVKVADANALVGNLARRPDAQFGGLGNRLAVLFADPPLPASVQAARLAQAVTCDPENPVLHLMLAEVYLRMNESELVIQQCLLASQRAKSWASPFS